MKTKTLSRLMRTAWLVSALFLTMPLLAKIVYVKPTTAGNDVWAGQTVYNNVASAIAAAESNDEVWIAGGTYEIGSGGINYNVAKNLKFFGSFAGTETSIDERAKVSGGEEWDFQTPTILKMTHGSTCVWVNNSAITATFDGLTFDGDNIEGTRGIGGNNWTNLYITRCIIKNNNLKNANGAGILGTKQIAVDYCLVDNNHATKPSSGSKWGGGICILVAGSSVKNSTVSNNSFTDSGGGIGIDNVGNVVIANCRILGNSTSSAGGGVCGYQIGSLYNCLIKDNTATGNSGGVHFRCYGGGTTVAYNNIIANNTSGGNGGAAYFQDSGSNNINFYNNIVAENTGNGGVHSATGNSKFTNNIFYGNKTSGGALSNIVYSAIAANSVFKNNIYDGAPISGLIPVNCIVETNPAQLFTNLTSGNFMPPAMDFAGENKGDDTGLSFQSSTDYAGNARVQGEAIEIGAYELVPSSFVALKSLKIEGVLIDDFLSGKTEYSVILGTSATDYPTIEIEPASGDATVSTLTYSPQTFDSDAVNVVSFTVSNGDSSTSYVINFTVDKMPELSRLILTRIRADKLNREIPSLEIAVDTVLPKMQADGSFSDCHYVSAGRNDSEVLNHLIRLREMSIAYAQEGNKYYENEDIYGKIVKGLEFWYSKNWSDSNWWQNRIAHPQRLGETLIALCFGKNDIRTEPIFTKLVTRWRNNLGHPDTPNDATTAGANKCDIAMHWIYRACLTHNEEDLALAADRSFLIVEHTTGEGVQHDWSYRQHGAQLYIGGYGIEFIQLVTRQASYLAGTKYALAGEKLDILSQFVRNTYLPTVRGQRMNFSVMGRSVTRTNNTNQSGFVTVLRMLKEVDVANADTYNAAIDRLTGQRPAAFNVPARQTHYYRGEYTLQQRPEYTFDVRMVSKRMARSEYDINENKQGFFMSDGATGIFVDGEEYGSILPFWNWKKIPGTTLPDLAVMRRANSYIASGVSEYAGGVTDGAYGVTAFNMINNQELHPYNDDDGYNGTPNNSGPVLPALDFGAKKSWFIFDKEIVCLGAGIYSGHEEPVFTTVNQCRQAGETVISTNNSEQTVEKGSFTYNNVDWALNDKVAYFFPEKPSVNVANETKTGSWHDINNNGTTNPINGELFTLWFDHGVRPTNAGYAYIIVPNVQSVAEAKAYQSSNIEILANTDSLQVVYHKELKVYGLTFFRGCSLVTNKLYVTANEGCVVLIKDADKAEMKVWMADPQKQGQSIKLGIKTPYLDEMKEVIYKNPASPHTGKSLEFVVNNESPKYAGKDVLLNRTEWTIVASSEGPVDATVAVNGDVPQYIIDGNNNSAFLFVKPGKTYGGVTVPAGVKPSFTIDMKQPQEITYLLYRHRDYNNTTASLRVKTASFYGKNTEDGVFLPIIENFNVPTDVTEVRIDFPKKVSYRYVQFVMESWDTASSSTIQTSEFNLGNTVLPNDILPTEILSVETSDSQINIYPNPVKQGQTFCIGLNKEFSGSLISVYSLSGIKIQECKAEDDVVALTINQQGVYIISVKKNGKISVLKTIVN